ncbi:GTPase domain-containing protein [Acinetobacter baumannii]|uniref:GTPase domain-containing protein n=1 Tax=Acinetobacter baumannii TaxID=470 RepID=UPI002870ABA8|nr:GTPase domain-containing protein [Acinetobacter baumannii]MDR9562447.1 GTPase domain-containing protein [Acinetobacter baumannii]MDV7521810.1 GTPase domain-containing protein [Acinetobacter baumannii]
MILFDRNWKGFWEKLKNTYSGFGNSITIVGFFMTLIALVYPNNTFPYLLQLGIGSTILVALVCIYQSWPDKVVTIEKYNGRNIPIGEISMIYPLPFKIGVVGCSKSGKTTFLNKVNFNRSSLMRTNEICANVFKLPPHLSVKKSNVVVVDGDGNNQSQQFDIMDNVDYLIVFFDHNEGNIMGRVVQSRLDEHEKFMEQMIFHLKKCKNLKYIHLVLNKHDLWKNSVDIKKLEFLFEKIKLQLEKVGDFKLSASFKHSNNDSDCIAEVLEVTSGYLGDFNNDR